ncbi:hypothetical protein [Pseudogemmobacter sp. W21_MBD1_M6]|uniref:hypothetical protein n=1 Tax=Pseudogemmobacter sp. W21_MBD1_M6 TaxID=3240271 RepID=UPI003F960E3B
MNWITSISFDDIALSVLACCGLRSLMILTLPDHIAGPGGRLIDTGEENENA